MDTRDEMSIYRSCTRFLRGHYPQSPKQALSELTDFTDAEAFSDRYGEGEIINRFEGEVATLLGKEAAVFMPSGTMCQQIALRIWCDRRKTPQVAFHPTCHLDIHEQHGYQRLHGLRPVLLGARDRLFTLDDLKNVKEPLGAVLIELPQREIGGQLPCWEKLNEMIAWAREQGIPTHLDGARLWECQPYYKRQYAEIAGLFDTVYVSFYKGLGGIAGAMLIGPADVIAEARIWQRRHGGNLVQLYSYVLAAQNGFAERLGRMEAYCAKAKAIAVVLSNFPQIELVPNPPHTNMMQVFVRGELDKLREANLDLAQETHVWLLSWISPTAIPAYQKCEVSVGDATMDLSDEEIGELFRMLVEKAH
jgi:threonine aldolase